MSSIGSGLTSFGLGVYVFRQLKREKASLAIVISDAIEKLADENEKTVLTEFYIKAVSMDVVAGIVCYSVRHAYLLRKWGVEHLMEVLG